MRVRFENVFSDETKLGRKIQTSEYLSVGKYPVIDQGQAQIAGYTDLEDGLFTDVPAIVFGDHTRIIKYIDSPFFLGADGVKVLKAKVDGTDYKYLFYCLQNAKIPNTGYNRHFKWLKEVEIPLPPLDEQRRIAAVLDKVSDLIAKRREQLDKLDELVKARFVEMFGDETETGRWPSCTIADIADVCVGVVIKPTQYYTNNGIPAFRSLNIGEMCVKDDEWVYFTKEGHQKNQKSIVRQNDVLVVRSGAPGTACVVTEQYDGYNAVDIIIAHPDNTKINSTFLAEFTNMPHGKNQIRERTGGAAQQHFNVSGYKALHLIMPPMCQQEEFASFFEQTNKSKLTIQQSLDKIETLKKALMQEYFG